jgi:glycosyltransferase involved in cell wall biosynthesis
MDYMDLYDLGFFGEFIQRELIRRSNVVIGISKYLTRRATKLRGDKSTYFLPHPAFPEFLHITCDEQDINQIKQAYNLEKYKLIGYQGSLLPNQGVEYLIDAFNELDHPSTALLIVGASPKEYDYYEKALREKAKSSSGKIVFTGYIQDSKRIPVFLRAFDVAVAPKPDLPYNRAAMVTKVLQYTLMGIPVVSTKIGMIPEMLDYGKGGFLAAPSNIKQLKEAIQEALEYPEKARKRALWAKRVNLAKFDFEHLYSFLTCIIGEAYLQSALPAINKTLNQKALRMIDRKIRNLAHVRSEHDDRTRSDDA